MRVQAKTHRWRDNMSVTERFTDKRILIWGYGREGKSTEDFLNRCCKPASIEIFQGKREEIDEDKYDYIFKSPGIVMHEDNPKYTSQTQVFMEEYGKQTIGITGTKGKSTTSSLLYTVLNACSGRETLLMGNIGLPCLDYFDHIDSDTIVVFELSAHQLAHTSVSPHVGVFLNLYEDHLDYYQTMDRYYTAKTHVAFYQTADDYCFVGSNVPEFVTKGRRTVISNECDYDYDLSIEGNHNRYNAEFVYRIVTEVYGCEGEAVRAALKTFTGLAHRLQKVATVDGVDYYDDSISTIPQATISAATSLSNAKTLLIGGMDRGIDYTVLEQFIPAHNEYIYICMYESGKRIYDAVTGKAGYTDAGNLYYVEDLKAAVSKAKEVTKTGYACVLSPAAASYGYFKNFEERGDVFKEFVVLSDMLQEDKYI